MPEALGDYIGGTFLPPEGDPLISTNPAREGEIVLELACSVERVTDACAAAAAAGGAWARMSRAGRQRGISRLFEALQRRTNGLVDAIVAETGKIRAEAEVEVASVLAGFEKAYDALASQMPESRARAADGQFTYYRPLGVVAVVGPLHHPLFLIQAHLLPALLLGNTVVVKPSEVTPLCAQRYFEAVDEADFPPGVVNLVQGRGRAVQALVADPGLRGVCYTGRSRVGRNIRKAARGRSDVMLTIETGGKNTAIVLDDAELRQAAHEVVLGAYSTTGQRHTATSRVLVERSLRDQFCEALERVVSNVVFGDPEDPRSFAGPMATEKGRARFEKALSAARRAGTALIVGGRLPGGSYARPSVHVLPEGCAEVPGYTDVELFGPDLCVQPIASAEEALELLRRGPPSHSHAVFTRSRERYDRILRQSGVCQLHWNCATIRSAGAEYAEQPPPVSPTTSGTLARRVISIALPPLATSPHPALIERLPGASLELLEAQHLVEEAAERERWAEGAMRPMAWRAPRGGDLPLSSSLLQRLYAGKRVAREKKPPVFDHMRSTGPWLVSVDPSPMSVLDAMSQTATMPAGFSADEVVRAYIDGDFGAATCACPDTAFVESREAAAFRAVLAPLLGERLGHISFTNSGAEANEKALALCLANRGAAREARTVVAFEGSFHGRTMLALHATWNPDKRGPFELDGYEARFAPFPVWTTPQEAEPRAPRGYYELLGEGLVADLLDAQAQSADPLLRAELESLAAVDATLRSGRIFACIVEPMQSEGGDRYATRRFFRGLRLLTRAHRVPLIFDEVQTGFGLGGTFLWHHRFDLRDRDGKPDGPDAVTLAKRAQVGVCASRFEDPAPTSAHTASLVRGRIHASLVADGADAQRIEGLVRPRLADLGRRYPQLVHHPRATGYAVAFDLPDPAHLSAYIAQRFWRGAVVFGAGTRTVRYRLNRDFGELEVEHLFQAMRRTLSWLDGSPGATPPAWQETPSTPDSGPDKEVRIRRAGPEEADEVVGRIMALERVIYERARRDPEDRLRLAFGGEGLALIAVVERSGEEELVGYAVAAPLEDIEGVAGPSDDPQRGARNTLYSIAVSVDPRYRGRGVGRQLKSEQVCLARAQQGADGQTRYRFISGRNRVGMADTMTRLNRKLGAYGVFVLDGEYGEPDAQSLYYRIPLTPPSPTASGDGATAADSADSGAADLSDGIARPFGPGPPSLRAAERDGLLYGPAVNKITLLNYVTPAAVRAIEWVSALTPKLPHLFLTSSRDELVDKALRILRWHRSRAQVAIGFEGGYVGHTSAAARSLSDPGSHCQGAPYYAWPLISHPADVGAAAALKELRAAIGPADGGRGIFGVFLEPVQERTGRRCPDAFWPALETLRQETDIPVVLVETASACYRSCLGPFAHGDVPFEPDAVIWWGGGQVGFIHVGRALNVEKPLAMASTWDGDELSLIRVHHHLRAARGLDLEAAGRAFDEAMDGVRRGGFSAEGLGLYRVVSGPGTDSLQRRLRAEGVTGRLLPNGAMALAPRLDRAREAADKLAMALARVLG